MDDMTGLIGIMVALGLLILFAFRGVSVLLLGPIMAALAVIFAGEPVLATYTQLFLSALGDFIVAYFPLFLLGAIFRRLMDDSGVTHAIATAITERLGPGQAIPATVLACAALTYGGVSLFVVAFAMVPVAAAILLIAPVITIGLGNCFGSF